MTPQALNHLARSDKTLGRLIKNVGPCALKPKRRRSPFEALVQSVAYQQLNGTAAATILGRVRALYPGRQFPTPEDRDAFEYLVVTRTIARSGVAVPGKDAPAASGVPSETAAHATTTVRASSSNGR